MIHRQFQTPANVMDYQIISNQNNQPYQNLEKTIIKHFNHPFQKIPNSRQQTIFNAVYQYALSQKKPVIFDGGCGRGMSTERLAQQYPNHLIIGLDKSIHRLSQNSLFKKTLKTDTDSLLHLAENNIVFVQADLFDFLLLAHQENWQFDKQFYFYPNPWPKSEHFKRRLHGHPIFPILLTLSPYIEVRSNVSFRQGCAAARLVEISSAFSHYFH